MRALRKYIFRQKDSTCITRLKTAGLKQSSGVTSGKTEVRSCKKKIENGAS
jgi:hypothetical protein